MGTYLNGQLVIADDQLITGKLNMLSGGPITTPAAVDLSLVPGAGGITVIGDAGAPAYLGTPTNDDFFVNGRVEIGGSTTLRATDIRGASTFWQGTALINDVGISFGSGGNPSTIMHRTAQTPDTLVLGMSAASNSVVFCEFADLGVDFGNAQKVDPTLIIQSGDATVVAGRVLHCHDRTDGVAETGLGDYLIKTPAQKTLRLGTAVWGDHRVPLTAVQAGGLKPPSWTKFKDDGAGSVGVYAYAFGDEAVEANEEQMWFDAELPHAYKNGSDIIAHVHWSPAAGGAAGEFVKWGLEYVWRNIDGTFGNTAIIRSDASAAATATTSEDGTLAADKHYVTVIGTISGTGKEISSVLLCRIFRNSSDGDDDLTEDAFGLVANFHHEIDTMGSRQEMVK